MKHLCVCCKEEFEDDDENATLCFDCHWNYAMDDIEREEYNRAYDSEEE
jgi:predicted  nucleic acid-binding Zn-ribbon protein